jgi:hypothetical protein
MQRLIISIKPVKNGKNVDLGISFTTAGDIVNVQLHLNVRLMKIAK